MSMRCSPPFHQTSRFRTDDYIDESGERADGILLTFLLIVAVAFAVFVTCSCIKAKNATGSPCGVSGKAARASAGTVTDITSYDHFQGVIKSHQTVGCMFYAPWCPHCKTLKPEFETAASKLAHPMCIVNCEEIFDASSMDKYNIRHYPMVVRFQAGNIDSEHSGPPTTDAIVSFMGTN